MKITQHFVKGTPVISLLHEDKTQYVCCLISGRMRELTYVFDQDMDAEVEFLGIDDPQGAKIYEASIRFLTAMAIKAIDARLDVKFFYNISRSLFCRVITSKGIYKVTPSFVRKVDDKMKELIAADLTMNRTRVSKEEALSIYRQHRFVDKEKVLSYRSEDFVHLYECKNGIQYYDYLYSYLVPSTGYLRHYKIQFYAPGFVVQYPRAEFQGTIPEFHDETKFAITLASTSKWAEGNSLDTVSNINHFIKQHGDMALINLCEARVNNMLADLGNAIVTQPNPIRLICIAGPSSSGKTSFANRVLFELMSRGLRPVRISMDDFYIPRAQLPEGTDLESLEAIDVPLFNDTMMKLIAGESVQMPYYDFKGGLRKFGKSLHLDENSPIIIEGIHALNNKLNTEIPQTQKYKIYISPQPQVNIDNHTPVSMTDMRLIRRIARDARTRDSDARETIDMWPNVRHGEFKYIYPTQENADFVFDSFMPYEPCALRNIVLPLLNKIKPCDLQYPVAQRLKSLVKYFLPIASNDIPCNSLIREFVGGSSFKDAR